MASYHIIAVFLLGCLSCCCGKVHVGNNDELIFTNLTVVNVQSDLDKEFDGKGLEPWYDVAKSFIHTVQKDDLPYDDIEKIKDGDDFKVEEFLKGWELPFLVTFAIGFLFAIIVPIVGFCFCCCRCCGNCGGEMVQKQSEKDGLKRTVFGIVLAIITIIMFAGCLMAFVANDRITDTVESCRTTPMKVIDSVDDYLNKTLKVVTDIVMVDVLDVLDIVEDDVMKLPGRISDDVKNGLDKAVREPLDRVVKLGQSTTEMQLLLTNVTNKTKELQKRSKELNNNLTDIGDELKTACGGGPCPGVAFSVTPGANFSELPDVSNQLNNISAVVDGDLITNAEKGLGEFNNINETIKNKTKDTTGDIVTEIHDARKKFKDEIEKDIVKKVEDVLHESDGWKDDINKVFDDSIEPYDKYRYYAGVGLTCLILLPVLLMAFGLLCGIFGHDKGAEPSERGTVSNMGGNCLMAAVGFMFIFVFFLMLFTAICFLFGAHLEKGCSSMRDGTFLTEFVDNPAYWDGKYILADAVLEDKSISLTVTSVLEACRRNQPLFKAIQGEKRWNLTEKFSVRDRLGDFESNLDKFNVSIDDTDILNNETIKGLKDLRESGVDDIEFEAFFNETRKDIVKGVGDLRKNLTTLINSTNPNSNLTTINDSLAEIEIEASAMKKLSAELERDVQELKKIGGDVKNLANETLIKSQNASTNFAKNANKAVKDAVKKFSSKLLGYVDQTGEHSVDVFENQLGPCRILTDVYDASVNLLCRDTVFPFNGFWFSIGFCLFFYIPAIIFSVKLAKHYRRMRFEEGFDRHEGLEMAHVNDRNNKPWLNQGNSVYPK